MGFPWHFHEFKMCFFVCLFPVQLAHSHGKDMHYPWLTREIWGFHYFLAQRNFHEFSMTKPKNLDHINSMVFPSHSHGMNPMSFLWPYMVLSYVISMENVWNFHDLISIHWPWKTHGIITDHGFPMAILLCQNAMGISWIITMGNFYKGAAMTGAQPPPPNTIF